MGVVPDSDKMRSFWCYCEKRTPFPFLFAICYRIAVLDMYVLYVAISRYLVLLNKYMRQSMRN